MGHAGSTYKKPHTQLISPLRDKMIRFVAGKQVDTVTLKVTDRSEHLCRYRLVAYVYVQ